MADTLTDQLIEMGLYEVLRQRLQRVIAVPAPAVGLDWSTIVPAGVVWELLCVEFQLVTSAVVANRNVAVRVLDSDGNTLARYGPGGPSPASVTGIYTYAAGYGLTLASVGFQTGLPTPPVLLLSGWTLGTGTAGRDVGDQFNQIFVTVREWSPQQVAVQSAWIARQLIATELQV